MIKPILKRIVPENIRLPYRTYRILNFEYGHLKTTQNKICVDKEGNPIPWYTYPAIEYIKQLDFSNKEVFEYGSGYSSIFWARRCKSIVSVEDSSEWYNRVKDQLPTNAEYLLLQDKASYTNQIFNYNQKFDVIVIDGNHRYECAMAAREKLSDSGMIILDNSDWKEKTTKLLRESNLIQIDMAGFRPMNDYTWTTSFFLSRGFDFSPACDRQPMHGIGSLKHRES